MAVRLHFLKVLECILFSVLMAVTFPVFAEDAAQSDSGQSAPLSNKNSVDVGWLPNIQGIPDEEEVEKLTQHVADVMAEEDDEKCNAMDYNLRMVVFQNFVIYQHMSNKQHYYFKDLMIQKYAHVLHMILKESDGDSTNVTDMTGRSVTTSKSHINLDHWHSLLKLSQRSKIKLNEQTNFGLTQLSADRLFVAFKLAHGADHSKDFLEGKSGDATPNRVKMNTSIAIRRLIWFYQDFAQGRLTQDDNPIKEEDIYKPEFNERYQTGIKRALLYCGTRYLFNAQKQYVWLNEYPTFEKAMSSIAYCKLGNPKEGYGKHKLHERCFAEWVTLCPALNVNIALLTPLSYFQTRNEKPICLGTFKRLLIKDPDKQ